MKRVLLPFRTLCSVFAVLFAGAAMVGCIADGFTKTSLPEPQGDATGVYVQMSFPQPAATRATRATSDTNATDDEAAIHSVDVYIYTADGSYLSRVTLAASDFSAVTPPGGNWDAYKTNNPIATTTGGKNFYVGVNLPSSVASSLENQAMTLAASLVQTIDRSLIANTTNGLPMFSTDAAIVTLVKDPAQNTVTANVARIVAKVTVETDQNIDNTSGVPGRLGTLQWAINNQNTKFFLQQGAAPQNRDPNWTTASYNAGDFAAAADGDYVAVDAGPVSAITAYHPHYALENTSEDHTEKTLTRVTVRSTFIPQNIASTYNAGQGGDPTTATNPNYTNNTPATFWAVTASPTRGTFFFDNSTAASNYASDNGAQVRTYTGGMCYWNIYLNLAASGDVVRNDFYKCNITRIVAPGNPNDLPTDPNSPPDQNTSMTVNVNVLYWNTPVMDNYELVP